MAKPTEASPVDRTALLGALNRAVEDQERYTTGLKEARDIMVKAMLNGDAPSHQHRTRQRRRKEGGASRTQMLQTLLDNASGPVTVDDLEKELQKHGRRDERRLIYSTLSYLARKGTAKTVERGRWVSCTEATAQAA